MQRRFAFASAAVAGFALASVVSAQVQVQAPAQDLPLQIQVQAQGNVQIIQGQVQPGNAAQIQIADRAVAMPAVMYNQNRLMQADAIVVGRVVAMEPMDVEAAPAPGQANVKHRVAVVQVSEIVHGLPKDTKNVRVAFIAHQDNGPNGPIGGQGGGVIGGPGGVQILPVQPQPAIQPAIQPFPGGRRPFFPQVNLAVGNDGMFVLNKHHKENFYVVPMGQNFIQRENNPGFDNEVKTAKTLAKVMDNPVNALKAEDKQDRYLAAAILITRYRSNPTGMPTKSEPIAAEESKLILQALQGGDWTVGRFNANIPNPFELFNQMNIGPNDGYKLVNVRNQQDIATAMQKWLDENNGKYIIQKLVVDPNAKVNPPIGIDVPPQPPINRPPIIKPRPPIKGGVLPVQPRPVPAPDLPIQIDVLPVQPVPAPQPVPLPIRREDR